jgi:hypothetical protein
MFRLSSNFSNNTNQFAVSLQLRQQLQQQQLQSMSTGRLGLSSSMIDRIYKAKPGCSACGKK